MTGGELDIIISRYLDGSILPEDLEKLEEQMHSDPDLKAFVLNLEMEGLFERYIREALPLGEKLALEKQLAADDRFREKFNAFKAAYELLRLDRRIQLTRMFRNFRKEKPDP